MQINLSLSGILPDLTTVSSDRLKNIVIVVTGSSLTTANGMVICASEFGMFVTTCAIVTNVLTPFLRIRYFFWTPISFIAISSKFVAGSQEAGRERHRGISQICSTNTQTSNT